MADILSAGVFEDRTDYHHRIAGTIRSTEGFEVVAEGWGLDDSLKAIEDASELNVAFIDGQLDDVYRKELDGDVIARALREKFGLAGLVLVNISNGNRIKGVELELSKDDMFKDWTALERLLEQIKLERLK